MPRPNYKYNTSTVREYVAALEKWANQAEKSMIDARDALDGSREGIGDAWNILDKQLKE